MKKFNVIDDKGKTAGTLEAESLRKAEEAYFNKKHIFGTCGHNVKGMFYYENRTDGNFIRIEEAKQPTKKPVKATTKKA